MAEDIYLSATSIGKLTGCENKFVLSKTTRSAEESVKSVPLLLGTLMHRLLGAWYAGRSWRDELHAALDEDPHWEEGFEEDEYYLRARDIMIDWETMHGASSPWPVLALELPFDLPVPGVSGVRVRGFLDGVIAQPIDDNRTHDIIKVLEFKTMGRWGREDQVPDDPQLHLYMWASRQMFPVQGAVFEAISTYKYKEPSPAKRFKRIDLPYDERKVDMAVNNLVLVARRAKQLLAKPELAIRNVGGECSWCDYKRECLRPWEVEERKVAAVDPRGMAADLSSALRGGS